MPTIISTKDRGYHARMDDDEQNMHYPKLFLDADLGTYIFKDPTGNQTWENMPILPPVLGYADSMSSPPTEVFGNIYILDNSFAQLDVNTIAWQSGNTIRYTFNGSPDLSGVNTDDYLEIQNAGNISNNGIFVITTVNDGSDWIEITNTDRSDATDDEGADSPATGAVTHREWDGSPQNSYVKFNGTTWEYFAPSESVKAYDISVSAFRFFNGTQWVLMSAENIGTLSKITGIDCTGTGTTNLFTVSAGQNTVITGAIIIPTTITGGGGAGKFPSVGIGIAAGEDDIFTSTKLTGLSAVGKIYHFNTFGIKTLAQSGNIIKFGVDIASNATTYDVTVHLLGYKY